MSPKLIPCSFGIIALLICIGCSNQPTNELTDADRKYLQTLADRDAEWILGKQWDTLALLYAKDAVRHPPNGTPVIGRDAIRDYYNYFPPIKAFHFKMDDIKGDGQYAFMRASYDYIMAPPGANEIIDTGKILIVFRKEPDGKWLRVADAWNSNLIPAK